jgi:hypothetical protein
VELVTGRGCDHGVVGVLAELGDRRVPVDLGAVLQEVLLQQRLDAGLDEAQYVRKFRGESGHV